MSCPQIALDCKSIISFDNESSIMSGADCYLYGTALQLNFNQQLSGVSIPIIGVSGTGIVVQGNLSENYPVNGFITISGSSDAFLNTDWSPVTFTYDEGTDTTYIELGYASVITEDFGIIEALSCCYTMTYKVENTGTGEIIEEFEVSNCEDSPPFPQWFQEQYTILLNTTGPVRITIGWETCYGYQECYQDINVCSTSSVSDSCHLHTIHYEYLPGDDALPVDLVLNIYTIDSDGVQTLYTTQSFLSSLGFDYVFNSIEDGVYYYEVLESGSTSILASNTIIDDCDARACWATILADEYCIPCASPCQSGDADCFEEEKTLTQQRRNALNVMTSDFWMLLNLTEKLTNEWTTKNPIYLEDYLNDLTTVAQVIAHLKSYIKNCTTCS